MSLRGRSLMCVMAGLVLIAGVPVHAQDAPPPPAPPVSTTADEAQRLNADGLELFEAGAFAEAIDRFTRARDLWPAEPVLARNLASAHAAYGVEMDRAGRDAVAIQHLRYAIEVDPANAAAYYALVDVYYRRGDYAKAQAVMRPYAEAHAEDAGVHGLLADLYYRTGDMQEAVGEWEAAIALDPDDADLRKRLEKAKREMAVEDRFAQDRSRFFTVRYEGNKLEDAGYLVLQLCDDARRDIGRELRFYPQRSVSVILYTDAQFDSATQLRSHVAGLYDGKIRIRVAPGRLDRAYFRRVVYHEYGHLVVGEITRNNCPYWLNEGLAQWLSEDFSPEHRRRLRAAPMPSVVALEEVDVAKTEPERLLLLNSAAFALVDFLRVRYSSRYLLDLLQALGDGADAQDALQASYRRSYAYLDKAVAAHVAE